MCSIFGTHGSALCCRCLEIVDSLDTKVLIFNWTNVLELFVCSNIYLWSKGCLFVLFVFIKIHPTWNASDRVLGVFGKLSTRRDAWAWFHDIWTCSAKVLEYWMILSLIIKLNHSLKFSRNWNVPLMLFEKILMSKI